MRPPLSIAFVILGACGGSDDAKTPDSDPGNHPPPRVIPGGGIGDGAVDGVVNLYVIDDATRLPVTGAMVEVGTLAGTTDATGLFVANGVIGAQTVAVAAPNYESTLWIGANGANVTIDLTPAIDAVPDQANLSGAILGFEAITLPAGHDKTAVVVYSQDDKATSAANNIATANSTNFCDTGVVTGACTFTVTTRTGAVALAAVILDHDLNGTPSNPADDTYTVIGWATRTGITVVNGIAQTGQDLTMVAAGDLGSLTIALGTPPSGLQTVEAVVGIDLAVGGTLDLPLATPLSPSNTMMLAPLLAAFPGATYRLTGIANNGSTAAASQSVTLDRGLTTTSLASSAWLSPPVGLQLTRTGGSWTAIAGALIQSASYDDATGMHLLNVTPFDGSTAFTIPALVALPTTGTLSAKGSALAGDIDLTNFALDTDSTKITASSSQPLSVD